ncbi:UDP-4-amino-4,6-dideoxy-N-acetyl-beta-L-altrosamine transaminase [Jiulongibacter sp. NS-SX5]|uniref:UDP-4-amino-4, 6-dideoxy-N-acetyl-beta-L-altrosamine transaminase n=1 Tax=Jiulongibacter sp. NS-SX5 TaxID=3463854 RepID=UPI004058B728
MMPIPYGRQHIDQEDINAVIKALSSDYLTQGPAVQSFEENFAKYVGSKYAVAVSNGTAALHLCALALGVKPGVNVITTPITFAASANCVRYCGGDVYFADIDPETLTLDPVKVEELILSKPEGYFSGIIPVDFAGFPVNLEKFKELTNRYNLWIIEDACHAPGGYFRDSTDLKIKCGGGSFANLAIFSFHPVKHIAAGEGGMITTNDEKIYRQLLKLRTHGITKNPNELNENHGGWYYEMQELGYNYRMPDILCALGESQLKKADEGIKRRREIAIKYDEALKDLPITCRSNRSESGHAYHLYVIETDQRLELYEFLKTSNIYCQVHYIPVHLLPYYKENYGDQSFPNSETYYSRCLSLPMYPSLSEEEQDYVIMKLKEFYG